MTGYRTPPRVQNPTPGSAAWQRQIEQNLKVLRHDSQAAQSKRPPRRANGIAPNTYIYNSDGQPFAMIVVDGTQFRILGRGSMTAMQYTDANLSDPFDPANYTLQFLGYDFTQGSNDDSIAFNFASAAVGLARLNTQRLTNYLTLYGFVFMPELGTGSGTALQITSANQVVKASSSLRYKQDIDYDISVQDCIDLVESLRGTAFRYKDEVRVQGDDAPYHLNFIAEDVAQTGELSPTLIFRDADGRPDALQEQSFKVVHNAVLQHLLSENRRLTATVDDLTERLERLEASHAADS